MAWIRSTPLLVGLRDEYADYRPATGLSNVDVGEIVIALRSAGVDRIVLSACALDNVAERGKRF